MFHRKPIIDIRRHRSALLAALVGHAAATILGAVLGAAAGVAVTRSWRSRQLAAALADAATWRTEALHDPLTGLPNRRAAVAEVHRRLADHRAFLLALLDLDDFKTVNDTHGHPTGDDLLTVVAACLTVAVSPGGFVARLGGDEFLVLLPDHGGDPAGALTPVLALLAQPVRIGAATLRPHASAGVAATADGAIGWHQLTARADRALYRAKTTEAAVAVYDPRLDTPTTDDGPRRPRIRRRDRHPHRPAGAPTAEPDA
ncbi:GGDEF domain-containing protein [Micromonospora globbae]|uniref:GGDEF domain-containing protein n=1 Tax=Micromonospora globbae TaxID=1894969 RepID=UPI003429DC6B